MRMSRLMGILMRRRMRARVHGIPGRRRLGVTGLRAGTAGRRMEARLGRGRGRARRGRPALSVRVRGTNGGERRGRRSGSVGNAPGPGTRLVRVVGLRRGLLQGLSWGLLLGLTRVGSGWRGVILGRHVVGVALRGALVRARLGPGVGVLRLRRRLLVVALGVGSAVLSGLLLLLRALGEVLLGRVCRWVGLLVGRGRAVIGRGLIGTGRWVTAALGAIAVDGRGWAVVGLVGGGVALLLGGVGRRPVLIGLSRGVVGVLGALVVGAWVLVGVGHVVPLLSGLLRIALGRASVVLGTGACCWT